MPPNKITDALTKLAERFESAHEPFEIYQHDYMQATIRITNIINREAFTDTRLSAIVDVRGPTVDQLCDIEMDAHQAQGIAHKLCLMLHGKYQQLLAKVKSESTRDFSVC